MERGRGLNRQLGEKDKQSLSQCGLVGHCLSPCSRKVSSCYPDSFLPGRWFILKETLFLGVVSVPCHEDVISSVFCGIQSDCKRTAKRVA
jgi:hypothetical protein